MLNIFSPDSEGFGVEASYSDSGFGLLAENCSFDPKSSTSELWEVLFGKLVLQDHHHCFGRVVKCLFLGVDKSPNGDEG